MDKYILCVDNLSHLGITLSFIENYWRKMQPFIHIFFIMSASCMYFSLNGDSIRIYPQLPVGKIIILIYTVHPHIRAVELI